MSTRSRAISLVAAVGPRAAVRHLRLSTDLGTEPVVLLAEAGLILRMLENLVDHCSKYTPAHGSIVVRARRRGDGAAEICVTDDGPCMSDAERAGLLERPAHDASRPHARTSVGLALRFSRLAAEAHGGKIWTEAGAHGVGNVFCVELPRSQLACET